MPFLLICQYKYAVAKYVSWCCSLWLYRRKQQTTFQDTRLLSTGPRKSIQGSQHLSHIPPALYPPSMLAVSTQEKHSKGGIYDENLKSSGENIWNAETAVEKQKSKWFSTQLLLALQAKDVFTPGCSFVIKRHTGNILLDGLMSKMTQ